jgi:hypothetical protein
MYGVAPVVLGPRGSAIERRRAVKRWEMLWLAFEKFALFFAFVITFFAVTVLLAVGLVVWQRLPALRSLKEGVVCETVMGFNSLVDDLENAVITQTIQISQTIPVRFDLPLDRSLNVRLTEGVQLNRPTTFVLPGGGGQINGTVTLMLPRGQKLPVHMKMTVPVNHQLPVRMEVPVAIPLRDTELGDIIDKLKELLAPFQLKELERALECPAP